MLATVNNDIGIVYANGSINLNEIELTSQINNLIINNPSPIKLPGNLSEVGADIDISYDSIHTKARELVTKLNDIYDYDYNPNSKSFTIKSNKYLSRYLAYDDIAISNIQLFGPNGLNVPNIITKLTESETKIWTPENEEYNLTIKCIYSEFTLVGYEWSDPVKKVIEVENFRNDIFYIQNIEYKLRLINILMFKLTPNG